MSIVQSLIKGGSVPSAPTITLAETLTATSARVTFNPPASGAPILDYTVTAVIGGQTATAASSPIDIAGLSTATQNAFTVRARNASGLGLASAQSNLVMPTSLTSVSRSVSLVGVGSGYQFERNGDARIVQNGAAGSLISGEWTGTPVTILGDHYEARMTINAGTIAGWSLAAGTWFDITSNRLFGLNTTGNFTLDIRSIGASNVLRSFIITIT